MIRSAPAGVMAAAARLPSDEDLAIIITEFLKDGRVHLSYLESPRPLHTGSTDLGKKCSSLSMVVGEWGRSCASNATINAAMREPPDLLGGSPKVHMGAPRLIRADRVDSEMSCRSWFVVGVLTRPNVEAVGAWVP